VVIAYLLLRVNALKNTTNPEQSHQHDFGNDRDNINYQDRYLPDESLSSRLD